MKIGQTTYPVIRSQFFGPLPGMPGAVNARVWSNRQNYRFRAVFQISISRVDPPHGAIEAGVEANIRIVQCPCAIGLRAGLRAEMFRRNPTIRPR